MSRIERVNHQMKREIGLILQKELADPRFQMVTITAVEVSKDLRHAKVRFSVMGSKEQISRTTDGLNGAKGIIRKLVGENLSMRYTPELVFFYDASLEYSANIDRALEEIRNEPKEDYPNN